MFAEIRAIAVALPDERLTNEQLAEAYPEWTIDKIESKTGIRERRVSAEGQTSGDLAVEAAQNLFDSGVCSKDDIDFILLCTQSPDYFLPTTACVVQDRLGVPTTAGALDFNLGCSGYIYGLGMAKGLIETGQASSVLLLTAETYTKFIHDGDKSVRTLFGDGAAATWVRGAATDGPSLGPFVYGTDGRGAKNLIVPRGGLRAPRDGEVAAVEDEKGNVRSADNLFMDGAEVFTFTLKTVPAAVKALTAKGEVSLDDVDCFVFHQASQFMLDHLRKRIKIPPEKFVVHFGDTGNTVSSTIPLALDQAVRDKRIQDGDLVALVGFGVGYSWGGCLVRWRSSSQT